MNRYTNMLPVHTCMFTFDTARDGLAPLIPIKPHVSLLGQMTNKGVF